MSAEIASHRTLDRTIVGGLAWSTGAKWTTQVFTWVSVLIAANLLSPADFGLMEMAGFVGVVSNVLAEFGIGSAVVQMRELDRRALAQLNTIALLFNTAAFAVSALCAPLVAAFFGAEQLKLLVIVNSLSFFLTALQSVPQGLLQRDLDYRRLSIAEAVHVLVQAAVTVACALAGFAYWSLLFGPMAGKMAATVLALIWKPVPFAIPNLGEMHSALRFGFEVTFTRLAATAYVLADGVVVGRMLGESALGTYRLAMNLASAPAEKVAMLIMRVTGPLFASIQKNQALVRRYFLFISDATGLVVLPLAFGLTLVAPEVVVLALGPKWQPAIAPMQWLAIFMPLRTMQTLLSQVLTSLRLTRFLLWMSILSFIVMLASFIVAARWGTAAVASTWLLTSPITIWPLAFKLLPRVGSGWREYIGVMTPSLTASAAMVAAVVALRYGVLPADWHVAWKLVIEVAAGGLVYAGVLWFGFRAVVTRYTDFLMGMLRDRKVAG